MGEMSRRGFLASGAGAAAVGVAAVTLPNLGTAAGATPTVPAVMDRLDQLDASGAADANAIGAWVVHIRDAAQGEVAVLTGESEYVFHDPALVARIVAAAGGSGR